MEDVARSAVVVELLGDGLVTYIQRTLLLREHLNHHLSTMSSAEQIFHVALAHLAPSEAPTVVIAHVPQVASYWFHTGRRAYIVLAGEREESYRQGVMLLGYHLMTQCAAPLTTPAMCAPFETTLWRMPAFFWPRFFSHCLSVTGTHQRLRQSA